MKLSRESWILMVLGTADLVTTILWIERGMAREANPLFSYLWNQGLPAFILAKYTFLLGPILIVEWARRRHPGFALWGLRAGALAYVLVYVAGVVGMNHTQVQSRGLSSPIVLSEADSRSNAQEDGLPNGWGAFSGVSSR